MKPTLSTEFIRQQMFPAVPGVDALSMTFALLGKWASQIQGPRLLAIGVKQGSNCARSLIIRSLYFSSQIERDGPTEINWFDKLIVLLQRYLQMPTIDP